MLNHKKHTKFVANRKTGENAAQNDVVLDVTEVAELLGREEDDIAAILADLHGADLTIAEDQ